MHSGAGFGTHRGVFVNMTFYPVKSKTSTPRCVPVPGRFDSKPSSFQWGWPLSPVSWSGRMGGQSDWLIGVPASQAGCSAWWPAGLPVRPRAWLMSRPASSHAASQSASQPAGRPALPPTPLASKKPANTPFYACQPRGAANHICGT